MTRDRLQYLFDRYTSGLCTPGEKEELAVWVLSSGNEPEMEALLEALWERTPLSNSLPDETGSAIADRILNRPAKVVKLSWRKIAVAASLLFLVGLGSYFLFFNKKSGPPNSAPSLIAQDIPAPATNRAMITLGNGKKIFLDSAGNGELAVQHNVKLLKTGDGRVIYQPAGSGATAEVQYNTLTNPRGSRVIDMTLSDGSHIWLNAGSSVTYPVAFAGHERKVSVTGEGYFEIAKDATRPFIVAKGDMKLTVLGTHFNVNAYEDEEKMKVTLLEGSVRIDLNGKTALLKPGQQAVIDQGLNVAGNVDTALVMAWKNGKFDFGEGTDLKEIMKQVARWYDVDIEYSGDNDLRFWGSVPRQVNVSKVLEKFELTGQVHFRIEGRKVIVNP